VTLINNLDSFGVSRENSSSIRQSRAGDLCAHQRLIGEFWMFQQSGSGEGSGFCQAIGAQRQRLAGFLPCARTKNRL